MNIAAKVGVGALVFLAVGSTCPAGPDERYVLRVEVAPTVGAVETVYYAQRTLAGPGMPDAETRVKALRVCTKTAPDGRCEAARAVIIGWATVGAPVGRLPVGTHLAMSSSAKGADVRVLASPRTELSADAVQLVTAALWLGIARAGGDDVPTPATPVAVGATWPLPMKLPPTDGPFRVWPERTRALGALLSSDRGQVDVRLTTTLFPKEFVPSEGLATRFVDGSTSTTVVDFIYPVTGPAGWVEMALSNISRGSMTNALTREPAPYFSAAAARARVVSGSPGDAPNGPPCRLPTRENEVDLLEQLGRANAALDRSHEQLGAVLQSHYDTVADLERMAGEARKWGVRPVPAVDPLPAPDTTGLERSVAQRREVRDRLLAEARAAGLMPRAGTFEAAVTGPEMAPPSFPLVLPPLPSSYDATLSEVPLPSDSAARDLCVAYYAARGEFAGRYVISSVEQSRVDRTGQQRAIVHLAYRARPIAAGLPSRVESDSRVFSLVAREGRWEVVAMGRHRSGALPSPSSAPGSSCGAGK